MREVPKHFTSWEFAWVQRTKGDSSKNRSEEEWINKETGRVAVTAALASAWLWHLIVSLMNVSAALWNPRIPAQKRRAGWMPPLTWVCLKCKWGDSTGTSREYSLLVSVLPVRLSSSPPAVPLTLLAGWIPRLTFLLPYGYSIYTRMGDAKVYPM